MIERGLREFPEEEDKMTDIIAYPFGYTAVLTGEAFTAIDQVHKWVIFDEPLVGGVPVVVWKHTNVPHSAKRPKSRRR